MSRTAIRARLPCLVGRRRRWHLCVWKFLPVIAVWECLHGYSVPDVELLDQPPLEESLP